MGSLAETFIRRSWRIMDLFIWRHPVDHRRRRATATSLITQFLQNFIPAFFNAGGDRGMLCDLTMRLDGDAGPLIMIGILPLGRNRLLLYSALAAMFRLGQCLRHDRPYNAQQGKGTL